MSPRNAKSAVDNANDRKKHYAEKSTAKNNKPNYFMKINDSAQRILFESTDLLTLVNMAGKDGWEITGGLGLANGGTGQFESKWRIMRKVL